MTTFASLFSGGGGSDLGAMAAGLTPLFAVEHDPAIAAVYRANIGPDIIVADVADVDYSLLPVPDLLHASPVCTNASQAKTDGAESPSDLAAAAAVCRALRQLMPRFFTLENVIPYRSFQSYRLICSTLTDLGYIWHAEHCNAADMGVPQTRRRLILRASRDGLLRGLPQPEPWVGWYAAIEDLIPTLPASKFAAWQLARLPAELSGSYLLAAANTSNDIAARHANDPAWVMTSQRNESMRAFILSGQSVQGGPPVWRDQDQPTMTITPNMDRARAFIVDGQANDHGETVTVRDASEPMMTVSASGSKRAMRAFLMRSQNSGQEGVNQVRYENDPAMTITQEEKPRAFLVGGANTSDGQAAPGVGVSLADEPTRCVNASNSTHWRAWLSHGRVVAMVPRALARFQSFPDSYVLPDKPALACKVIGNAVAPRMYQRIVETL